MVQKAPKPRCRAASKPRGGAAATKERILDSALKVFSEHGFDGTTMREVAATAGWEIVASGSQARPAFIPGRRDPGVKEDHLVLLRAAPLGGSRR